MKLKNTKILKVSVLASILSVGLLSGAYSVINKDLTLIVKGEEKAITTFKSNVKELLDEQNVMYDSNDIVSLKLDAKLSDGMSIEVIDVKEETIREAKEVPFGVELVEDSNLKKGSTEVKQEGIAGKNELVYTMIYHNGNPVEKKFVQEVVSAEPKNKIVKKGTKVEVQVASSRGTSSRVNATTTSVKTTNSSNTSSKGKHMSVVATAYTGDTVTSTGTTPKWGTIAVDPSIIPYGTKVYIPQFGMTFIAEDTGSAIRGNKIDIFMNDQSKVSDWGRKNIDIYIVG